MRHDVGTIKEQSGQRLGEVLDGIDTPTLRGLWHTAPYLHDGSADSIDQIFSNNTDRVHGLTHKFTDSELAALKPICFPWMGAMWIYLFLTLTMSLPKTNINSNPVIVACAVGIYFVCVQIQYEF